MEQSATEKNFLSFNLEDLDLCTKDDKLKATEALEAAKKSGKITPLLKEELWCIIQSRRLSRGCEELTVNNTTEKKTDHSLTTYDIKRQNTRRDQNKRAAQKYREKKRNQQGSLQQEISRLQIENETLKKEIQNLRHEKLTFEETLVEHLKFCNVIYSAVNMPTDVRLC